MKYLWNDNEQVRSVDLATIQASTGKGIYTTSIEININTYKSV